MVLDEEAAVDGVVFVLTDGDDGDIGHLTMKLNEAGKLFDAGRTPGGPQVEDDDVAAKFAEVN